jgi:hypothetical protein
MKERRSRAVLASKAGLEVPDSDQPFERKGNDMADGGTEAEMDNIPSSPDFDEDDLLQPIVQEREALKSASEIDKIPSRQDFKKEDSLHPMIPERDATKNASVSLDSLQGAACGNEINGSVCLILYFLLFPRQPKQRTYVCPRVLAIVYEHRTKTGNFDTTRKPNTKLMGFGFDMFGS